MSFEKIDPQMVLDAWTEYADQVIGDVIEEATARNSMTDMDFPDKMVHKTGSSTEMVQSYQSGIQKKGKVSVKPRTQRHSAWKVDLEFTPRDYTTRAYESYLVAKGSNPYDMPYAEFIARRVTEQVIEDFEKHRIFQGIDLGVIPDAPNPAQDGMNGLVYHVHQAAIAGEISLWSHAASTLATAADDLYAFVKGSLPTATWRRMAFSCHGSQASIDLFHDSYRENYGQYIHADEYGHMTIPGTNVKLVSQPGMAGNNGWFMTPATNLVWGYDGNSWNLEIEKAKREVLMLLDGDNSVDFISANQVKATTSFLGQP